MNAFPVPFGSLPGMGATQRSNRPDQSLPRSITGRKFGTSKRLFN